MPDVQSTITDAARRYGMNPDSALRIATVENSLDPGWAGVTGVTSAAIGDDCSRRDFRALTTTPPFQRMMGFTQFFN